MSDGVTNSRVFAVKDFFRISGNPLSEQDTTAVEQYLQEQADNSISYIIFDSVDDFKTSLDQFKAFYRSESGGVYITDEGIEDILERVIPHQQALYGSDFSKDGLALYFVFDEVDQEYQIQVSTAKSFQKEHPNVSVDQLDALI